MPYFHLRFPVRQRALLAAVVTALVAAPWAMASAASTGDSAIEAEICPNREKIQPVTIPNVDLLGKVLGPDFHFHERCDPNGQKSINSTLKGKSGFFAGAGHCGKWISIAPNTPFSGTENGPCGDFIKGNACPAPTGF
jgi:hypothetical protein